VWYDRLDEAVEQLEIPVRPFVDRATGFAARITMSPTVVETPTVGV
jgi:hypothetical protein